MPFKGKKIAKNDICLCEKKKNLRGYAIGEKNCLHFKCEFNVSNKF